MNSSSASRVTPGIAPGEMEQLFMEQLFGAHWDIEHLTEFDSDSRRSSSS